MERHGHARHDVHHVLNLLRGEHVRSKSNQETAMCRRRRRCLGLDPQECMVSMVTPLILHMYHAQGVRQAYLLAVTQNGTVSLQNARRNRLTVKHAPGRGHAVTPHRHLDVPRHCTPDVKRGISSRQCCRIPIISRLQFAGSRRTTCT